MILRDLIDPPQLEAAETALRHARAEAAKERDPVILKILTGFSAWVASLFLLGFIIVGLQPEESSILALGVMLAGLALFMHHKARGAGIFVQQSTLSCMMCAHLMMLFGVLAIFDRGDELLTLALTQTVLCALPVWAFRRSAYQACALLLAAGLWTGYAVEMNAPWLFRLLLAVEVATFGALALWRARRNSFTYALALAVGATIFFLDWIHSLGYHGRFQEPLWPTNLIMAALVAAVGAHFVKAKDRRNATILCAYGLLLALAFLSSPGLLYAIALLILGYGLRDPILGGLGMIALPLFIVYFYYSLDVSLLEKSGILFTSGVICLLAAYLSQRADKEVAQP